MLTSLALIFLVGLSAAAICGYLHLPRIIGMLFTGIILGPHVLGLLDDKILSISSELRQIALIIILLKAGLSLNLADLKKVGRPAVMMAFVPASFEICGYLLCAPMILGITRIESAVMGAVLAAVSPAVVVPRMVQLMENGYGTEKSIPQMILAGASCDDIFVIVLFSTFAGIAQGGTADFTQFLNIPVSIVLGILLGAAVGYLLSLFFETAYAKEHYVRNSMKVIVVLGLSFLLMAVETWAKPYVSVSGLLAVVSMACVLKMKCPKSVSGRLSEKFGKLWIAAEVVLFVMVGAAVDIRYTATAGGAAVVMILLALIFRAAGVCVCMAGTALNKKERLFTVIAYLPKATVQAAIGSVPMAMGLSCGQIVLSVAVLAILITAPLGAIGMDMTYRRLLKRQE
ncbi:sodium:proton antiporter [Clostridium sp. AF37-5AT]|jgi:NhaP-type Na+/H+ or K+/H+ antiporter|nr:MULTISPECIES: cation:proton antiporter [unclassified Clostridium]RHO02038.1 sodium:proton antiporter [Clostridium sp. AM22-16AC]RHO95858.1 sodium:proton antiporter [Clostridium sp. AF37-5AT]RHR02826.1 sodium:proton antiporter [Clostridium sp. AF20-17LB]RHS65116.1 sodium:proton antiporter [Clostridium sp. AM45-5]